MIELVGYIIVAFGMYRFMLSWLDSQSTYVRRGRKRLCGATHDKYYNDLVARYDFVIEKQDNRVEQSDET